MGMIGTEREQIAQKRSRY